MKEQVAQPSSPNKPRLLAGPRLSPDIPRMTSRRALLALAALAAAPAAMAQRSLYEFDESIGRIGFSARHLGLLSSNGRFERFRCLLRIDPARPTSAEVRVEVQTGFVTLPYPGAEELLRSPDFFDSERHPIARFEGRADATGSAERFPMRGELTIRGITRPQAMEARLVERRREGAQEIARFTAAGTLRRSEFGMTAERLLISEAIGLSVEVQLIV
jgi:polyisoprenoid-binding protein YceI